MSGINVGLSLVGERTLDPIPTPPGGGGILAKVRFRQGHPMKKKAGVEMTPAFGHAPEGSY
jgi:hypothetical protein